MLQHLTITNYAISEAIDLEFDAGMTAMTGETGAGKSITLDALGLALGDRADPKSVGKLGDKAEIIACFDIGANQPALHWLRSRELADDHSCLLRRVISREGKSRAFINGTPSTLQDLRQLGELLIDIHGQHEHQSLLRTDAQRDLLDNYAGSLEATREVNRLWQDWKQRSEQLTRLRNSSAEDAARVDLLRYQVNELREEAPTAGEIEQLETDQRQLANAETLLAACQQATGLCDDEDSGILRQLGQASHLLQELPQRSHALDNALDLLVNARIQVEEAAASLQDHIDGFDADPERLQQVEQRLGDLYNLARKHRVRPPDLPDLQAQLEAELAKLDTSDERLEELEAELADCAGKLATAAASLSASRKKASARLAREVNKQLKSLRMENCQFGIKLSQLEQPGPHGAESVAIEVSTNPGQPAGSLSRVASGGELSRIGLAIQVATAKTAAIPCMIFDEVDSGIGGAVAEVVGQLLRQLGAHRQVICVTHLAQVASQAHHHFQVSKYSDKAHTSTRVEALDGEAKVEEIARMLGGVKITKQTRAHAREMLNG